VTAGPTAFLRDADETEAFAKALGILCKGGERLALSGEMGAGKTTFVRGLASGLGIESHEISSPTFTLIHVHEDRSDEPHARRCLVHVDAYRLEDPSELEDLGWSDILQEKRNVVVVEWPQKIAGSLGDSVFELELFHTVSESDGQAGREIVFNSPLPKELARQLFTSCRTCQRQVHAGVSSFPFCGNRCRMADLGNWFDGNYSVSREIEEDDLFDSDLS
tara:strand:- start:664 stop:1323 length:660 start_codon:yes stop_codon:yes gene_type:complete